MRKTWSTKVKLIDDDINNQYKYNELLAHSDRV